MSAGEIVGLALTSALLGAVAGLLLARRRPPRNRRRDAVHQAVIRWLDARRGVARCAWSLVTALRWLATEDRDSPNRSLREQEAQRAKDAWLDAQREEVSATEHLRSASPGLRVRLPGGAVGAGGLREAVKGNVDALRTFREELRGLEDQSRKTTENILADFTAPTWFGVCRRRVVEAVTRVTDRWSRP